MIFGSLILLTALALSSIAAYYSVLGLLAIFAAAGTSIVALGSVLEVGKIVSTVWLHHNWHRANLAFKIGLGFFVAGLMFLTSMGIFGYLSKGHIDQGINSGDVAAQLSIIDEKIETQKSNIESARRALTQMDAAVDQILSRSTSEDGARRSAQLRRNQKSERTQLQNDIQAAQKEIARLNEERAPIAANVRRVEAEVGPIKYIAALIYGDNPGVEVLEKSVRWVIILIVAVFDPLALTLILAANKQFEWYRKDKRPPPPIAEPDTEKKEPDPVVDSQPIPDQVLDDVHDLVDDHLIEELAALAKEREEEKAREKKIFLEQLEKLELQKSSLDKENLGLKSTIAEKDRQLTEQLAQLKDLENQVESLIVNRGEPTFDLEPAPESIEENVIDEDIPELTAIPDNLPPPHSNVGFGTIFPPEPSKGDMFVRVDSMPTKLFKFSGRKWIEIDKTITDTYSYNEQYIKHIIGRLENGEYAVEDLTEAEKQQINEYLLRK